MWRELKMKTLAEQVLKTQVLIRGLLLYFTFDNGLEIRTEILRLFILCQFLLTLIF